MTVSRLATFAIASVAAHGVLFFTMNAGEFSSAPRHEEISISIIEAPASAPPRQDVAPAPAVMTAPALPSALKTWTRSTPPKAVDAPSDSEQVSRPAPVPAQETIKSSAELLTDPQKGRVFENYFVAVKSQIHEVVRKRYTRSGVGQGTVSLVFVLASDGSLENVFVADKLSDADLLLKIFAKNCVRDAAPFARFPTELDLPKISFNITVLFEDVS